MRETYTIPKTYNIRPEGISVNIPLLISKETKHKKVTNTTRQPTKKTVKPVKTKSTESTQNISSAANSAAAADLLSLTMRRADSFEQRYRILDARDKLIRLRAVRQSNLTSATKTIGTCPDMCPEKERLMREAQHQVALYEQTGGKNSGMNHSIAVKQYSRSSADQESPLAHELRPVDVLQRTMSYLLHRIMDLCDTPDVNLAEWFHFLWDRMRGIRKDITQQELCCPGSVHLVEQCARFHVHCSARLVSEDVSVFDQKINTENLTKCLQTLKYMYHDLTLQGICCENEPEFRGYIVLLNLNDGNFMWEVQQLSREIQQSEEIKFALRVYSALDKNNYVRFFKLVRSTAYLNACILLRYFNQVRVRAIIRILKSYSPRQPYTLFPVAELTRILAFEDESHAIEFLGCHGMSVDEDGAYVVLDRKSYRQADMPIQLERAINVIESKRIASVGETVCGSALPLLGNFEDFPPHDSFDNEGFLKPAEIPAEWQATFRDGQHLEEIVKETEEALQVPHSIVLEKPSFTFCAPSSVGFDVERNVSVPRTTTSFVFQSPKNLVLKVEKPDEPANNSIGSIKSQFFASVFEKSEPLSTFWGSSNPDQKLGDIFHTPMQQKQLFDTSSKTVFSPVKQKSLKFEKNVTVEPSKVVLPTLKNVFGGSESCVTDSKPLPVVFVPPTPKPATTSVVTGPSPDARQKELAELKLRQEISLRAENERRAKTERRELQRSEELRRQREQEETEKRKMERREKKRQADVYELVQSLVSEVEKINRDARLREISDKIHDRRIMWYINKWRNLIAVSKRKRKNFFDNPTWVSTRSVNVQARELYTPSQELSLHDMKRYKSGSPMSVVSNGRLPNGIRLDMFKTVWKFLFESMSERAQDGVIQLDIFWKVVVSSPSVTRLDEFLRTAFDWKDTDFGCLSVDRFRPVNGGTFTCCVEKASEKMSDDSNCHCFFGDGTLIGELAERFVRTVTQYHRRVPIFVIIYNRELVDRRTVVETLRLEDLSKTGYISKYDLCLISGFPTIPILTATLQWLAHHVEPPPRLEMDTLSELLRMTTGEEFWDRISSSSQIDERLKKLLRNPNVAIDLHNKSLDNLRKIILNRKLREYPEFPLAFKEYLGTGFVSLPCTYEYFPDDWKKLMNLKELRSMLDRMVLPSFYGKWPPETYSEMETIFKNYCSVIFEDSKIYIQILAAIIPKVDTYDNEMFARTVKMVSWSDVLEVISREQILKVNELQIFTAVYNVDDLKELRKVPWWYTCSIISSKIKTVVPTPEEEEDLEMVVEYNDSDYDEDDMDKFISELTDSLRKEDKAVDVGTRKDMQDLTMLVDDLEESLEIQKRIMWKFNQTANWAFRDCN